VFRAGGNTPLAGAVLTLQRADKTDTQPAAASATTDSKGSFTLAIRDLNTHSYRLTIAKPGYMDQVYGEHVAGPFGAPVPPIELSPGQTKREVVVWLIPAGTISGHVRDAAGLPVEGVQVQLRRRRYTSIGILTFQQVISISSNKLGEFRFGMVAPGRYYVIAAQAASTSFGRPVYSFFPGVSDIEKADVIDIRPGSAVDAIDFALAPSREYSVRGRLIDTATGRPPAQASIGVYEAMPIESNPILAAASFDSATGDFERRGLPPGKYRLAASENPMGSGLTAGALNLSKRVSQAEFQITDSDIDNLVVSFGAPQIIEGFITVEGELPPRVHLRTTGPALRPVRTGKLATFPARSYSVTADDGTFSLACNSQEPYVVEMAFLPEGLYLKQARLNGVDVLTKPADFSSPGDLQIVVSSRVGKVDGRVTGEPSIPRFGIPIAFVPDRLRDHPELFKTVFTDAGGRFSLSSIAPGDYKVFAWESLESFSYFDPEFLKRFEDQGQSIRVSESSRQTLELKIIRAEGLQ
jgi:hypothetical protein